MSIIEQLEKTVTPAVLGSNSSVAHISLLEQFYAILVARLALPQVYSQLLRTGNQDLEPDNVAESLLFKQLWQASSTRQVIIEELATTHHVDKEATTQLLMNAVPLVYRELKRLANGQFLPTFLQSQQLALRPYLPVWSALIITSGLVGNALMSDQSTAAPPKIAPPSTSITVATIEDRGNLEDIDNIVKDTKVNRPTMNTDAIHANPSAYHLSESVTRNRNKVSTRNQRAYLLVRLLLLIGALAVVGLIWALVIQPKYMTKPEPIAATAPLVTSPTNELSPQVLTPVELSIGVDDSGILYTCSASVGDTSLQSALQQSLNTSFGEQAHICELTVRKGVASTIPNLNIKTLPDILTLLTSAPFARLHLQNDSINLAAPDEMILQHLLTDIRILLPTMIVNSTAPKPLPNNTANSLETNNLSVTSGSDDELETDSANSNNQYNNTSRDNDANYQASDDRTGDRIMPEPLRNNNANGLPAVQSGPISLSEVDDLASNVIVAEPAQGGRPVNKNIMSNTEKQ